MEGRSAGSSPPCRHTHTGLGGLQSAGAPCTRFHAQPHVYTHTHEYTRTRKRTHTQMQSVPSGCFFDIPLSVASLAPQMQIKCFTDYIYHHGNQHN